MTWIPIGTPHLIGCDQRDVAHAVDFMQRTKKSRRVTFDAVCGARVRLQAAWTADGNSVVLRWPPLVGGAASVGLTRCSECYEKTGKPKPIPDMGSADFYAKRSPEPHHYKPDVMLDSEGGIGVPEKAAQNGG